MQLHVTRDGAGERSEYLLTDHLGSIHMAVGTGAEAPRTRAFDAFGRVTGGAVEQDAPDFTGHRHDTDLGLIDMKGRIYDPNFGRFLQPDPIMALPVGTGLNRYAYVLNNPMNYVDPWGLQAEPVTLDTIYITGHVNRAVDGAERAAMQADARMEALITWQPGGGATSGVFLFGGTASPAGTDSYQSSGFGSRILDAWRGAQQWLEEVVAFDNYEANYEESVRAMTEPRAAGLPATQAIVQAEPTVSSGLFVTMAAAPRATAPGVRGGSMGPQSISQGRSNRERDWQELAWQLSGH